MTVTMPVEAAVILLAAVLVPLALWGGIATERWHHWRRRHDELRRHHLQAMKSGHVPFIRPMPMPDVSPILAEIDAIRRELDETVGISNVVEVDFRSGRP